MKSSTKSSHPEMKVSMKCVPRSDNWRKRLSNWGLMNGLGRSWLCLLTGSRWKSGIMMGVRIVIRLLKVWVIVSIVTSILIRLLDTLSWVLKSVMPLAPCGLLHTMNSPKKYSESPIKPKLSTISSHSTPTDSKNKPNSSFTKSSNWESAQRRKEETTKWESSTQFQRSMKETLSNKHLKTSKWSANCPFHELLFESDLYNLFLNIFDLFLNILNQK